jgi:MinD superfamily P-loop ATPase
MSEKIVHAVKERIGQDQEIVLIDTAAGSHCHVVDALKGCDMAFAVTEPTPFGAHDLKVIGGVLETLGIMKEVVLNRSGIADTSIEASISIPYSREAFDSYVRGIPIVESDPEHPISRSFLALARRLSQ